MSEAFIGEIRLFAGQRPPIDWAFCDGQLLRISEYEVLFTLLQTTYGGDGVQTFALPDLRGRVPRHEGQGNGQPQYHVAGEQGGSETVTLQSQHMPGHSHTLAASQSRATPAYGQSAAGGFADTGGTPVYGLAGGGTAAMRADTLKTTGGSQPHNNMAPYLGLQFIISLTGIYPSQN